MLRQIIPGIFDGASFVFFSFIGFDCVSTLAEETKNPAVDMPVRAAAAPAAPPPRPRRGLAGLVCALLRAPRSLRPPGGRGARPCPRFRACRGRAGRRTRTQPAHTRPCPRRKVGIVGCILVATTVYVSMALCIVMMVGAPGGRGWGRGVEG